jgi:hypothetical protein
MRTAALAFCTILLAISLCAEDEAPPLYPVRGIPKDSEKFDRIYNAVADQLVEAEMKLLKKHEVEILQTISPQRYRVQIGDVTYALEIPGKPLPDGEVIMIPVVETEEVFQYTTVLGATSTIKVAAIPEIPKRLTKDQFLMLLEAGKHFDITMGKTEVRCTGCGGFGKKSGLSEEACGRCDGVGIFRVPVYYRVIW